MFKKREVEGVIKPGYIIITCMALTPFLYALSRVLVELLVYAVIIRLRDDRGV